MVGSNIGWTSPFVANLLGSHPSFKVTSDQIAWVTSLLYLARSFGVIIGSVITYLKGSKTGIYICGCNFIISWICLICATSIHVVFISLICNGIGFGLLSTLTPLFLSEIANPKIRGKLNSVTVQGLTTGTLFGSIMGTYLEPWVYAILNLIPSILFAISFTFIPNTPYYFMRRGKMEEAARSAQWYDRNVDDLEEVDKCYLLAVKKELSFVESLRKLKTGTNLKTLLHINVLYSVSQASGLTAITAFLEVLFVKAHINIIEPSTLVIIMGVAGITGSYFSVFLIDRYGRVILFFGGCILISISYMSWGLSYHLLDLGFDTPIQQWLTIVSSFVWRLCSYLCIIPTIYTLLGEFFAPDVKNTASCLTNVTNAVSSFLANQFFSLLIDHTSHKCVFYLFAITALLLGIYMKIFIIETKGKSLAEIQELLNTKNKFKHSANVQSALLVQ